MIYLDGKPLAGYQSDSLTYEVEMTGATVPVITYDKADNGQQVTIAAPVGPGDAKILVAPEAGTPNTYTIHFTKPSSDAVLLSQILVGGTQVEGWDAHKEHYTEVYVNDVPKVEAVGNPDFQQQITMIDSREMDDEGGYFYKTTIYVEAGGDSKIYTVTLTHQPSTNAAIDWIKLNDVVITEWTQEGNIYSYSRKLQEGEAEPVITFNKQEDAQTVVFGQKAQGQYQLIVLAADGKSKNSYNITLEPADLYTGTTLEKIMLDDKDITDLFSKSLTYNGGEIPEGTKLPTISYVKDKGQSVVIGDVSADQQQIIVVAENGASATYTINYTITKGTDTRLTDILLDGDRTDTKANQVAEGWIHTRAQYNDWVNIKVPIYYMNSDAPTMCNVMFSAGNYPNFRANSGLYKDNGLYVDDVELIYASTIQTLMIDNKEWKGFDPNSSEEQTYSLGEKATSLPTIEAWRGAGTLKNVKGNSATFPGRKLSGSEITIKDGAIDGAPTTITVHRGNANRPHE